MSFAEDEGYDAYSQEDWEKSKETKMQLSGIIAAIQSAGGYNGSHGYIYTFNLTLQDQTGQYYTGQIGSKSEQYPMQIGEPILVESTTNDKGTSFKKINPGYPQSGQQAPPQQQNPSQGQPPAQQPAPLIDPTPARIARACVVNQRDGLCAEIWQEAKQKGMTNTEAANMFAQWIEIGIWSRPKQRQAAQPNTPPPQENPPQGSGGYDPNTIPQDELPF